MLDGVSAPPRPDQLTVEQLAAEAGLPTSTIRMYQTKGLLHAPRRHGRTARYDATHLDRLRLVQRMQARGFSLPAIAELIEARDSGASVASVLGLGGSGRPDDWVPVRLRHLRAMIPARELRPRLLRRASQLGLVRWRRGKPYTRRWALDGGARLTDLQVPATEILDRFDQLRAITDDVASNFVEVFERQLWPRLAGHATEEDQLDRIRELLVELTTTAEGVVVGALRESIRDAAEEFAERHGLLPEDGSEPAWARAPVPVLADTVAEGESAVDENAVQRFLNAPGDDPEEESR
jgi:DNA-binding transcriptional MerR regulator